MPDIIIRPAAPDDIPAMARIWHDGWQDGHAALVSADLAAVRTMQRFSERLEEALADVLVATQDSAVAGLVMLLDDELYQFYVDGIARGTGLAAQLMHAAEAELARRGHDKVFLYCAIGNDRAARFYEKCGWHRAASEEIEAADGGVSVMVPVWRYEKAVSS